MKRPPLPSVQTNGIHSSQSSRSPSLSSKRPPGFKQPPTPTVNGVNGDVNGLGPRLSNRRKDSQKPGEAQGRPSRAGRGGLDGERRPAKRMTEPYIKTQDYVLKRHRSKPPSLILHLHSTHFRFDTQDVSFSYNSPMKFILEHLKAQTIPHGMMEELVAAGTRFYDGCLIVQIQDHRTNSGESSASANVTESDNYVPFSIHNYNEHITPSPYVPYPKKAETTANEAASNIDSQKGESADSKDKEATKGPNKFTLVLFPTPLSVHEEVIIQANTVDPRQNSRKQSAAVPRTPASATIPPTPSSVVPPTPSTSGPPAKKQKMMISGNEIHSFESKLVNSTAPPLFLDLVEGLEDAHRVLENLTDHQHKEPYPEPKVKKRTEAELAADEAIAAQEQDFMLIMDERYASGAAGTKGGGTDGEAGIPTFQPNFEQWQAIRNIRAEHKERAARELEAKAMHEATQQANRLRKEQQEKAAKQEMERRAEQLAREQQHVHNVNRQNQMNREMHAREMQRQALAAGQSQLVHGNGHPLPNGVTHTQVSSPIVRMNTPKTHSSPMAGNVPMNVTSSSQGITSSPARPPSAVQNAHPGGMGMGRQLSRQQGPSRTSTPQVNGTPAMPHATPVIGQHATPRMPQNSPPMGSNPTMNQNVMANGHLNGQPAQFSPEQQQQVLEQRQMQQMYARNQQAHLQQLQRERMQNGSPSGQMSPEQRNPAHMQSLQQQAAMNQQRQYQQSLRMHHASMNGPPGHPNNGSSPPQQNPQQPHPQQRPTPVLNQQQRQNLQHQTQQVFANLLNSVAQKYGGNPSAIPQPERLACEQRARQIAGEQLKKHMQMQAARQAKDNQQAQFQQMAAMNGMNVQGMSDQQRQALMQQMQGMQQMSQMPHMGGNGAQNVNGLMHNQHMNGNGMGGMQ